MLLIALAIKIESRGPVIYKNERVYKRGTFNVYKFRSMFSEYCVGKQFVKYTDQKKILDYEQQLIKQQSERKGPVYKIINDPRRTVIGRFLEKISLDELPQLFNVVKGDMSFVGPRPALFNQADLVALRMRKNIQSIIPGLTGWAQINGRDELPIPVKVEFDEYYFKNRSFWLDMKILYITIRKVLKKEGIQH